MTKKTYSPIPYFLLTALLGLVPVLNNKYPTRFFPAIDPGLVELLSVGLGVLAAFLGLSRVWDILVRRSLARELVREAAANRQAAQNPEMNDVNNAGRLVSRLVRNADEDLLEIRPDFSLGSLNRLQHYLPALLDEIGKEEDARIRLGIVGTYLGETACRNLGWQWFFKADPSLRQFSYLVSAIRKGDKELDPYLWAGELLKGKSKISAWFEAIR
ncbi:MAG TPA: hypothetical protein VJ873_09535 [bacterium]|nr:hypothetical protein [bacterium]